MHEQLVRNFKYLFFGTYELLEITKYCGIQFAIDISLDGDTSVKTSKDQRKTF